MDRKREKQQNNEGRINIEPPLCLRICSIPQAALEFLNIINYNFQYRKVCCCPRWYSVYANTLWGATVHYSATCFSCLCVCLYNMYESISREMHQLPLCFDACAMLIQSRRSPVYMLVCSFQLIFFQLGICVIKFSNKKGKKKTLFHHRVVERSQIKIRGGRKRRKTGRQLRGKFIKQQSN